MNAEEKKELIEEGGIAMIDLSELGDLSTNSEGDLVISSELLMRISEERNSHPKNRLPMYDSCLANTLLLRGTNECHKTK